MDLKYGMNVHLSENEVLEKMKEAGIKWFRIDVNWFEAEPEKNKFNWGRIDRVVTYCKENSISIFASIGYTPGWANSNKGHYYPPDNISDWEN
jgi:beta-galactosidase GanA